MMLPLELPDVKSARMTHRGPLSACSGLGGEGGANAET